MYQEAGQGVAELFQTSVAAGLGLDAGLAALLFGAKLLAVILSLLAVARKQALVSLRKCVIAALALGIIYFLCDTEPDSILTLRPFVLVVLCGTFLFRRLFETSFEKSFVACLLYSFLAILMTGYANRLADRALPGRLTLGSVLTASVDNQLRKAAGDPLLPSSPGLMPALMRASWKLDAGDFVKALTTPIRVGIQAKEQIAKINAVAAERVALAEGLAIDHDNAGRGPGGAPEPAATGSTQTVSGSTSAPPSSVSTSAPPAQAAPAPEVAAAPAPVIPQAAPPPVPPAPKPAVATAPATASSTLAALGPKERDRWQKAQQKIAVSGVGRSGQTSYALVGGRMIRPNQTTSVTHMGLTYTFTFQGLDNQNACRWEPVLEEKKDAEFVIAF